MGAQFDSNALLYRWNYREADGSSRFIGTDPAIGLGDGRWFRWINEPGGWDRREPWPQGTANAEKVANAVALISGWPGAVPMSRGRGRPKKELADDDRPTSVSASVRRSELYEMQLLASAARKSVSEWIAGVIREQLAAVRTAEGARSAADEEAPHAANGEQP